MNMNPKRVPLLLSPEGKDYIWGGERLKEEYHKNINLTPLAETWECSTHPDGLSRIKGGEFDSMTLADVLEKNPSFLGEKVSLYQGQLPILIKYIDAKSNLSVQVHPSDEYAFEKEGGQRGKSEMWYVLSCLPGSKLVYGLKETMSKDEMSKALKENTLEEHLNYVDIHKGDVFYIPSGTIHAIGKGALIAEIQESSNLTYRLYDYGRLGKDGKPRQLHIEKSLDVASLSPIKEAKKEYPTEKHDFYTSRVLVSCKYFDTIHVSFDTKEDGFISYSSKKDSFEVLMMIEGSGSLTYDGKEVFFKKGDTFFVPSESEEISLRGKGELLRVHC